MEKRLYRSIDKKIIFGVCGGIGEYFGIDPTLIRLVFLMLCFMFGGGFIVYIIAGMIMPLRPY